MQLLKLTQSYNATSRPVSKQSVRNGYLNILQHCSRIPKDDRLVIRKYLCSLAQFDDSNEVVSILRKHGKSGKENRDNNKLEVALRKIAEKLRKDQVNQMLTKTEQPILRSINQPKSIDPSNYCRNFDILKQSLRILSSRNSSRNSPMPSATASGFNSNVREPIQLKSIDKKLKGKLKQSCTSLKQLKGGHWSHRSESTSQNIFAKILSNRKQQNTINKIADVVVNNAERKHKHTRSRSLEQIAKAFGSIEKQESVKNNQPLPQTILPNFDVIDIKQSLIGSGISSVETKETRIVQNNLSNYFTQPINNTSCLPLSASNFYSAKTEVAKSVHLQLKKLALCSEQLINFLNPASSKMFRFPSDISLPYHQFIEKLNVFIKARTQIEQFCQPGTLYYPFQTQYDLVNFKRMTEFIEEYTVPDSGHPVLQLYSRIEMQINKHSLFTHRRISIDQFKSVFYWKGPEVTHKFENLVKRCNRWLTCLTYWEFFWLKDCHEFQQFQREFNKN